MRTGEPFHFKNVWKHAQLWHSFQVLGHPRPLNVNRWQLLERAERPRCDHDPVGKLNMMRAMTRQSRRSHRKVFPSRQTNRLVFYSHSPSSLLLLFHPFPGIFSGTLGGTPLPFRLRVCDILLTLPRQLRCLLDAWLLLTVTKLFCVLPSFFATSAIEMPGFADLILGRNSEQNRKNPDGGLSGALGSFSFLPPLAGP